MGHHRLVGRRRGFAAAALLAASTGFAAETARADISVLGPTLGGYSAELQLSPECRVGDFDASGSLCLFDGISAGVALGWPYLLLGGGEEPAALGVRGSAGFLVPPIGGEDRRGPIEVLGEVQLASIDLGFSLSAGALPTIELRGRLGVIPGASLFGEMSLGGAF